MVSVQLYPLRVGNPQPSPDMPQAMTRDITYVLGHSEGELARLVQQASFFDDGTEQVLRRAGLRAGHRVLDLGCGAGDVSMIAARIVGREGSVTGVDRAEVALATARRRASDAGCHWVRFQQGELGSLDLGERYDAIIGRFILMYLPDPAGFLAGLGAHLVPGGSIAFIELDVGSTHAVPDMPLYNRCVELILEVYARAGIEPNMASKIFGTFKGGGLDPELYGTVRVEDAADPRVHGFVVETLRSLMPMIESFDIAEAGEVGLDSLADRLAREAVEERRCILFPRLVGAWARPGEAAAVLPISRE